MFSAIKIQINSEITNFYLTFLIPNWRIIQQIHIASQKKFQEKFNLPFTLLSDTEKTVIQAYDVWKEKNMYGKKTFGVVRTTYLIDENGIIVKAFGNVKAADNPQQMLNEI